MTEFRSNINLINKILKEYDDRLDSIEVVSTTKPNDSNLFIDSIASNVTSGSYNMGIGGLALSNITSGSYNTGIGYQSLNNNITGINNTSMGINSCRFINSDNNTGIGYNSLYSCTTGQKNTCLGSSSNVLDSDSINRTAIGYNAICDEDNSFQFGDNNVKHIKCGNKIMWANPNDGTFDLGSSNKLPNTYVGNYNAFFGTNNTWPNFTSAQQCVGIGTGALNKISSGNTNMAIGFNALGNCTSGPSNVGIGRHALLGVITANNNVGIGYNAMYQTTSGNNVGIGTSAGANNITGNLNTYIGTGADSTGTNFSNVTAIGYESKANANNQIVLGNASINQIRSMNANGTCDLGGVGNAWKQLFLYKRAAPTNATAPGSAGQFYIGTDNYIYFCTSDNVWVRSALTTWP